MSPNGVVDEAVLTARSRSGSEDFGDDTGGEKRGEEE